MAAKLEGGLKALGKKETKRQEMKEMGMLLLEIGVPQLGCRRQLESTISGDVAANSSRYRGGGAQIQAQKIHQPLITPYR